MLAFEKSFELFLTENNYAFSHFIDEELQAKVYQLAAIPLQIIILKNDQIATEEQAIELQKSALKSSNTNAKRILLLQYQWEFKREIVASRLRSLMGLNQKIHGRKCQILRVDKLAASEFLIANHLQGNCNARYHFALVLEKEIVAIATFSAARMLINRVVPARSFELLRFASKKGFTVVGGLTKILHHFQGIQAGFSEQNKIFTIFELRVVLFLQNNNSVDKIFMFKIKRNISLCFYPPPLLL